MQPPPGVTLGHSKEVSPSVLPTPLTGCTASRWAWPSVCILWSSFLTQLGSKLQGEWSRQTVPGRHTSLPPLESISCMEWGPQRFRCWPGACWVTRLVIFFFFFKLGGLSPCFLHWPSVPLGPRLGELQESVGCRAARGRSGGGGSGRFPGEVTSGAHPQPTPRICPSPARPVGSPSSVVCR